MKGLLMSAAFTMVVMAVVYRVEPIRKVVLGA